jgi:uncharacterized protein YoxC
MSKATDELEKDIQAGVAHLQQLRDEVRLKLHLAGMDAKDAWAKLEPKVHEAEHLAHEVSETTKHAVEDVLRRVREFSNSIT